MQGPDKNIEQKQQKVFLVVIANTVVNPGTVVVHASDAATARRTVVCAWGFQSRAFFALTCQGLVQQRYWLVRVLSLVWTWVQRQIYDPGEDILDVFILGLAILLCGDRANIYTGMQMIIRLTVF
jgi:hypothetical protein